MSCSFVLVRGALLLAACFRSSAVTAAADDDEIAFFEKEIRPTLVISCQGCHGPNKQRGGLRLDSRDAVLAGGNAGPVVVPGKPEQSALIAAIRHKSDVKMPPKVPLPEPKIAAFVRWVELGLPWPTATSPLKPPPSARDHWAFQPVKDSTPPAVRNEAWVRTPIDRFVLAKLEAEGLTPSPPADRRTLMRRVSYDVTGLPPTPEEVDAFVRDESADAYAKLIERLLASPQYGEQWGRHWLDVARYSDSKGYVFAREERFWVHAWAYRDWVIRSLNADLPYDRFVGLQLAADQLAPNDPAAQAAMGFLTLGRRFLGVSHDIVDDRIDVTTRGLMGLTVACARCHDHKYDPIPTDDYYSLYGVFRSASERVVPTDAAGPGPCALAGAAIVEAQTLGLRARQKKLDDTLATRRAEATARARGRAGDYLRAQLELRNYPEEGFDQVLAPTDLIPATVRRWRDYLARSATRTDPIFAPWHAFAKLPREGFADRAQALVRNLAAAAPGEINPLVTAAFVAPPRDMADVAARYGELFAKVEAKWQIAKATAAAGLPDPSDEAIRRILYGAHSPCEIPDEPIVNAEGFFPSTVCEELWKLQGEVDRGLIRTPTAGAQATVLVDCSVPTEPRIFRRGNPATPTEFVPRQFLQALSPDVRKPFRNGSGRLELAKAIADPANPLTARVMVNRIWMHHFGAGLVRTPSDFGTRADPPSHPELLDWLAGQFVSKGWSTKAIHRQILLSATFRQSSRGPADRAIRERAATRDPENRWLWRANPRRLSFEELRDSLFAATGELDRRGGGRAIELTTRPYSPRRAVYGLIDRQFFPDLLRTFDVANPDLHIPQRSETMVPQQALFFLNHPLLHDRATALARHRTVAAAAGAEEKVARMYRLSYQREPTPAQVSAAVRFVGTVEAEAKPKAASSASVGPGPALQIGAWEQLAQALLMANEFCFVD